MRPGVRQSVLSCGLLLFTKSFLFGVEPRVPAVALAFSLDGNTLLVGGHGEVRTYSVARGERESALVCEFPKISALAFSPGAGTLAVSGGTPGVSGGVILLEWPKGKVAGHLTNHTDQATAVAFNPAGTMLASAGADRLVQVVNWPQKTPAYRLEGHSGPVLAVAFSPDNALLLTASADRSIKVWDAATGQLRRSFSHHTWTAHDDWIYGLAISPDGRVLATGDWKGIVKLWDARETVSTLRQEIR